MMRVPGLLLLLALLPACSGGARDVDYPPERGISADIAASHASGATSTYLGRTIGGEPLGAFPWTLDERHAD